MQSITTNSAVSTMAEAEATSNEADVEGEEEKTEKKHKDVKTKWKKSESLVKSKGMTLREQMYASRRDRLMKKFVDTAHNVARSSMVIRRQKDEKAKETAKKLRNQLNDLSSSESEDDEDTNVDYKAFIQQMDLPPEFWQAQKVIRYLRIGNQTATVISLCNLADFDLSQECIQVAIMDAGGIEVLTNLLETDETKCKIGSLMVLSKIAIHSGVRKSITNMGGVELTIETMEHPNQRLQLLATETIANLAKYKKARSLVRGYGGIQKLIMLLDVDAEIVS